MGGNTFDVLFIGAADVVYRQGSLYAAITQADLFVIAWTMALVAVLGAGLVRRERRGVGKIGLEGATILVLYLAGSATVAAMG
ncbi:MAG: hypothetical protein WD602_03875 [Actinomycetota bacterium]